MIINPFTYANPISNPAYFIGRQREAEQVFSRLRNVEFESTSLVGEHHIGKTSLLNYLAHPDVHCAQGFDLDKYLLVYVDLQTLDKDTLPTQLWQLLLGQIALHCKNFEVKGVLEETIETDVIDTFALADVFDCIDENNLYVVFLLDQFEKITENKHFGIDFFYGLRSLATRHHLALVTASCHELIDLSHSEAVRSSPFFNIFATINLRLFSEAETKQLITSSLRGSQINFTEPEIDSILHIAGCHPYYLQMACFFLFDAYIANLSDGKRSSYLYKKYYEEARMSLTDYWHNTDEQEKMVLVTLALLERHEAVNEYKCNLKQGWYSRFGQTLVRLEKRSLLVSKDDTYRLFNASFGGRICQEITDTMHDQQSYSEWLSSNKETMQRLSDSGKKELEDILPRISSKYRELIISWVHDPRNQNMGVGLLRSALNIQ